MGAGNGKSQRIRSKSPRSAILRGMAAEAILALRYAPSLPELEQTKWTQSFVAAFDNKEAALEALDEVYSSGKISHLSDDAARALQEAAFDRIGFLPPPGADDNESGPVIISGIKDPGAVGGVSPVSGVGAVVDAAEELRRAASSINHCGDYGHLFLNKSLGIVFWVGGDADGVGHTQPEEISARFLALPGVNQVLFGEECSPFDYDLDGFDGNEPLATIRFGAWNPVARRDEEYVLPRAGWQQVEYPAYPVGSTCEAVHAAAHDLHDMLLKESLYSTCFYVNDADEVTVLTPYKQELPVHVADAIAASLGGVDEVQSWRVVADADEQRAIEENPAWREV